MSRFINEISGKLGSFWQKQAEEEVKQIIKKVNEEAIIEEDGAIRWKMSGHYIPDDLCEKLEYAGYPFNRQITMNKRDIQVSEWIKNYNKNN